MTMANEKNMDNVALQELLGLSRALALSFVEVLSSRGARDFDLVASVSDVSDVQFADCTADLVD